MQKLYVPTISVEQDRNFAGLTHLAVLRFFLKILNLDNNHSALNYLRLKIKAILTLFA